MTATSEPRADRLREFLRSSTVPEPYISNTATEEKLLTFVDDFEVLFHKYFPDRKKLLLAPTNECNRRKMICTFLRPTALRYDELFNIAKCSDYVAGYMQYETLYDEAFYADPSKDEVGKVPTSVVSPTTAFGWQIGNSLEMSLALASLLIGSGYNAFVVVGYAHRAVVLNDQSERLWHDALPEEVNSDDEPEPALEIDAEYAALMKERPILRGVNDPDPFVSEAKHDSARASDAPSIQEHEEAEEFVNAVHFWVLVLPKGRRAIKEAIYIEPSTGQHISCSSADAYYIGVESVFNHEQYFVNMHPESLVSVLTTDLKDASQWESLFPTPGESDEDMASVPMGGMGRRLADLNTTAGAGSADQLPSAGKVSISVPLSWAGEIILSPTQFANRYPNNCKTIRYANATVHMYAEYSQPDLRVKEVVLPDSISEEESQVHVFYKNRLDKLYRRSIYPLTSADQAREIQMGSRASNASAPMYRKLHEWYEKGRMRNTSVEGLREFIHEPGVQRTMRFYWKAREDGLATKIDVFYDLNSLRKTKEFYKGRIDHLCYRSASFAKPKTVREANIHSAIVFAGSGAVMKEYPRLEPIRLSQKYTRSPDANPDKEVAKTTFIRPQGNTPGEMWVFFHFSDESIIRPYHMFSKPSSSVEDYIAASASRKPIEPPMKIVTMPGAEPPSDLELYNERKWLSGVEASCLSEVRTRMDQHIGILVAMEQDNNIVQRQLSSYDTLRNRPKETEAERAQKVAEAARREESRRDYLAPYIAKLDMPANFDGDYLKVRLTMDQARQVRDEALLELKERLIQRGHIMQSRMDKEKEDFSKRQIAYQKICDAAAIDGGTDAEEFALYCKEATWRMKVLDERLAKHIDHASEKYAELAQRLSEDPRLGALY